MRLHQVAVGQPRLEPPFFEEHALELGRADELFSERLDHDPLLEAAGAEHAREKDLRHATLAELPLEHERTEGAGQLHAVEPSASARASAPPLRG